MPEPAMLQIHQQKREVVENVDAGEGLVELEAIEQCRFAVQKADIAKMQIAVAMAHLTGCTAAVEQLRQSCDPFLPFLPNALHSIPTEAGTTRGCETAILHVGEVRHLRRAA